MEKMTTLHLIDLDIDELHYYQFISAWLHQDHGETFLVDPGPACTVPALFEALSKLGAARLDWILLTHIHMDHAGGIGHVLERFPEARIACHEKAVPHLIDPARLWKGSIKVLGRVAEIYGPIQPVPENNIVCTDSIPAAGGIRVIPTPGHAAHHQCFATQDRLFCGELFGIFHELPGDFYLRPATPPVFVLEDNLSSFDRIQPYADRTICFGHYGSHPDGKAILSAARQQILLWVDVVRSHADDPDNTAIIADLLANDHIYARLDRLPPEVQKRERYFTENTITGMRGYIAKAEAVKDE
jgi:glyoxylase-like metal-dependent hydrolase (beta-lactamase superfamily II)